MRPHSVIGLIASYRRQLALTLFALWVGAVAYVTLKPAGYTPPLTLRSFLCVGCGMFGGSDIIRNWVLFIPGGLIGALVFPMRWAVALPVFVTVVVEVVQIGVPGREPALQDLVFNSLGAASGVLALRNGLPHLSRRFLGVAVLLAWLAPLPLLVPQTTQDVLWGMWTPRLGGSVHYMGRVLDASVGEHRVGPGRLPGKPAVDAAIARREPVRVVLEVGPQPTSWSPVFQVVDGEQQEIVLLGALGPDLILRGHNPARILRLDQPDVRWPDALSGVAVGDTVMIVVDRGRDSVCMSVGDRERCNLAPSLAEGWGHVLNLEGPPLWFRALLSMGWALGLGGLLGLTAGSHRTAMIVATTLAMVGYLASTLSPDVSPSLLHAGLLVCGALAGALTRRPIVLLWKELRPS